jgi:hypothetical protein
MNKKKSHRITRRQGPRPPAHKFDTPGKYVIYSTPKFLLTTEKGQELVACPSRMVIETGSPRRTTSGVREVSLILHEWAAVGESKLLGGELRHTMLKPVRCYVRGGSKVADLPGVMSIKLRFETRFNGNVVSADREGMAVGNISSFPPNGRDIFDISSKKFQVNNIGVQGILCACNQTK